MINTKFSAALFSIILLVIVMVPITENWKPKPKDSFPLSYYPMFSYKRGETYTLKYIVGYDSLGLRYPIPYSYIGNGGFNQVRRQCNKYFREGNTAKLGKKVAKRLAKCNEAPLNQIEHIALVEGVYHLDNYFLTDNKMPLEEKVYGIQKIERP